MDNKKYCYECKHFKIKDLGNGYSQFSCLLNKHNYNLSCEEYKIKLLDKKIYYFGIKYIEKGNVEQLYYHKFCDKSTTKYIMDKIKDALKNQLNIPEKDILKTWLHPVKLNDDFAVCINDSVEGVTKGKVYKIEHEAVKDDGIFYDIVDDYGIMNQFRSCRFCKIEN